MLYSLQTSQTNKTTQCGAHIVWYWSCSVLYSLQTSRTNKTTQCGAHIVCYRSCSVLYSLQTSRTNKTTQCGAHIAMVQELLSAVLFTDQSDKQNNPVWCSHSYGTGAAHCYTLYRPVGQTKQPSVVLT